MFMTCLAAVDVLLARYSRQDDIVLGTPIVNRRFVEVEPVIGPFLNTLVLRADVSGGPGFRDLLDRVRASALDAFEHGETPFEQLVTELQPERDLSRNPLFQVLFATNEQQTPPALDGVESAPFDMGGLSARFDLSINVTDTDDGLRWRFEYNRDLFDSDTVAAMAEHLQLLVERAIADPGRSVWELPILTVAERSALLQRATATTTDYPRERRFTELFEDRVRAAPDAVAAVCRDEQLTYDQLNRRANQLARHLIERGASPGVLVGISVERSLEMLVGLLAIMKSGAAYVPLDPAYPSERLAFIIEDAAIELLLSEHHVRSDLPRDLPELVLIDGDAEQIAAWPADDLAVDCGADALAYVIFTSGLDGSNRRACRSSTARWSTSSRLDGRAPGLHGGRRAGGGDDDLVRHRRARAVPAADAGGGRVVVAGDGAESDGARGVGGAAGRAAARR